MTSNTVLLGRRGSSIATWCLRAVALGALALADVHLPASLRLLTEASAVVAALSVADGAWWLGGVLRSVADGRPFERRNPGRLVGVTGAVLTCVVLAPIVDDLAGVAVLDHLDLVPALLVLAVAEAFRRGAALTDDVDGLV